MFKELELNQENIIKLILGFAFSVVVYSTLSYSLAPFVYLIIAIVTSFIITYVLPGKKIWGVFVVLISVLGAAYFAVPPQPPVFDEIPSFMVYFFLLERQAVMLSFILPALIGLLGGLLGWGMAWTLKPYKKIIKIATYLLLVLFVLNFVFFIIDLNPSTYGLISEEPGDYNYNNLNSVYLKTFYLMKKGDDFYDAFQYAQSRMSEPTTIMNRSRLWIMPVVFYLWKIFLPPNGFYIFYLYLLFSVIVFYLTFQVARAHLPPPINLVPVFSVSYIFYFGALAFWFAFPEYWGLFFLFIALFGIYKENKLLSVAGLTMAVLVFPVYLIPVALFAIFTMFVKKDWRRFLFLIPLIAFAIVFFIHYQILSAYVQEISPGKIWFNINLPEFYKTVFFGRIMVARPMVSLIFVIIMAVLALRNLVKTYWGRFLIILALVIPEILFFFNFGLNKYYLGLTYMPFVSVAACFIWNFSEEDTYAPQLEPDQPGEPDEKNPDEVADAAGN
ncbi:MAG: hypothetical protein ACLFQV_08065 [Vulcanimicrobiota bacterium]